MARRNPNRDTLSKYGLAVLVAVGMALAPQASQASPSCVAPAGEISPGAAVPGALGPICNGSDLTLSTSSTSVTVMFLGSEAAHTDLLTLQGSSPSGTIFNNHTTPAGSLSILTVTPGTLGFILTDTNTGDAYVSGQSYSNTDTGFAPVYHFADFSYSDAAAFNAGVLAQSMAGGALTSDENAYILSHGGYASWIFVGTEDLRSGSADDWNDVIFAFDPPTQNVPEPGTLALFASGLLGFAGLVGLRRRKTIKA